MGVAKRVMCYPEDDYGVHMCWMNVKFIVARHDSNVVIIKCIALLCWLVHKLLLCLLVQHE